MLDASETEKPNHTQVERIANGHIFGAFMLYSVQCILCDYVQCIAI